MKTDEINVVQLGRQVARASSGSGPVTSSSTGLTEKNVEDLKVLVVGATGYIGKFVVSRPPAARIWV